MKIYIAFIIGLITGCLIGAYVIWANKSSEPYYILARDYKIEAVGMLNKGTILQFDEGMDEGFDRFVLYLNIKGASFKKADSIKKNQTIPYWLSEVK